jgi:hypothetical protein
MNTFFRASKRRKEKMLRKLENMRAAKEQKRIERAESGFGELPPRGKVVRHPGISWAMRDDVSGEVVWMEFKSVRDMARRAGMVAKFYLPIKTYEFTIPIDQLAI